MSPPDWAQLNWSTLSSPVWRICTERWDHEHFDSHLSLTRCDPLWIFQVNILHIPFFQLFFVSCDGERTIFGFLMIKMGILTNFLTFSRQKRLIKKKKSDNSMVRIRVSCSPTVYVIEEDCDLCDFHTFVCYTCFRWEQRWTLTCWNTMKTPSLLFCVCTAGESAGREEVFTPPIIDFFFNVCVCMFVFRGLVKLWSSLTLLGSYQNQACAFRVLQVSRLPFSSVSINDLYVLVSLAPLISLTCKTKLSHALPS